ncbi:hypothetical protein AB0D04_04130 [Streptomyces sp. NPDC048483]|uniref:hypothetical protein n=1 Tax=Streptomyces sp. NPDC048483 TaxID=3154927 RepID=UPI003425F995
MSDSEFAVQVAAKLKSITQEIDDLHKLKSKLEDLQQHLGSAAQDEAVSPQPPETDADAAKPVTVPAARRAKASVPKDRPANKAPAKAAGGPKKTRKATSAKGKTRQKSPTRADHLLGLLNEQPRTVAELTKLLAEEHPNQAAPETAVRNTLEHSLVAKGLAHRSKQGRSVFYSHPTSALESTTEAHASDAVDVNEEVAPAQA